MLAKVFFSPDADVLVLVGQVLPGAPVVVERPDHASGEAGDVLVAPRGSQVGEVARKLAGLREKTTKGVFNTTFSLNVFPMLYYTLMFHPLEASVVVAES